MKENKTIVEEKLANSAWNITGFFSWNNKKRKNEVVSISDSESEANCSEINLAEFTPSNKKRKVLEVAKVEESFLDSQKKNLKNDLIVKQQLISKEEEYKKAGEKLQLAEDWWKESRDWNWDQEEKLNWRLFQAKEKLTNCQTTLQRIEKDEQSLLVDLIELNPASDLIARAKLIGQLVETKYSITSLRTEEINLEKEINCLKDKLYAAELCRNYKKEEAAREQIHNELLLLRKEYSEIQSQIKISSTSNNWFFNW